MLVLSRKVGEKIVIGDTIVLEVLEIRGTKIRLGITAPKDVNILRGELVPGATPPDGDQVIIEIDLPVDETNAEEAA